MANEASTSQLPQYYGSPSSLVNPVEPESSSISLHLPPRLLVLPPVALALGAFVGLSRGGSRARLRFLAENAHRQPTTVQGWVRSRITHESPLRLIRMSLYHWFSIILVFLH
jgi:hypothetical protein